MNLLQKMILKGLLSKSRYEESACITDLVLSFREYPTKIDAYRAGVNILHFCDVCNDELTWFDYNESDPINSCRRKSKIEWTNGSAWCSTETFVCEKCHFFYYLCPECGDKCQLLDTMIYREYEPNLVQITHKEYPDEETCLLQFHDVTELNIHYLDVKKFNYPFGPDGGYDSKWKCHKCDIIHTDSDK